MRVLGRNQLVIDIVAEVVSVLPPGVAVAILVDPDAEHWDDAGDRRIVAVLSEPTEDAVLAVVQRGADAVVAAADALTELPAAVETVRDGGVVLQPTHARVVVEALRAHVSTPTITLTRRERDIIESINLGDSVKQTALRLGIAQKTVENLQRRLFRKLDVRNRAQAVARVHALGLLDTGASDLRDNAQPDVGATTPRDLAPDR